VVFKINDENMALNAEVETENNLDTTPVPEQEQVEDGVQSEEISNDETTETTGEAPKKGFQARVQELNQKARTAEERANTLEAKLAELTRPVGLPEQTVPNFNPQEPIIAPGEEIDGEELNRRIAERDQRLLQQADSRSELRNRQNEAINRINSESSEVVGKYPELNPDSESFNKDLSDIVTEATEAYVKASPYTASVKTFVSKLMKASQGAVAREVGQATENIAKQVSQAALRPTSIRKPEKAAAEKSIAELEAELGIVNS